jgi:hypothetical protein
MSFRLAAAEATLPGDTLMDKFDFVQSVGFDGIELSGRGDGVFAGRAAELREARDAGVLMPTAVVHMDHFIGDFDRDAGMQLISSKFCCPRSSRRAEPGWSRRIPTGCSPGGCRHSHRPARTLSHTPYWWRR